MSATDQFSEALGSEPRGQEQPGLPTGLPAQPQPTEALTPQILMQLFPDLTAETAVALMQALPKLCGQAQQIVQGAQQLEQPQPQPQLNSIDQEQLQQPTPEEIESYNMLISSLGFIPTEEETAQLEREYETLMQQQQQQQQTPTPMTGQLQGQSPNQQEQLLEFLLSQQQGAQPEVMPQTGQRTNKKGARFPWLASTDEAGKTIMIDSFEMDIVDSSIIVKDGALTADTVMTAAMVQDYSGKKVLKDPEHLKKSCDMWPAPIPCTNRHPKEGIVMSQDEIVGWTTPPTWDENTKNVRCSIRITDGPTIAAIQDGKTDVSIGFFCDLEEKPGTFDTTEYDAVQENIVYNHLAVALDKGKGRCPDGTCGIQGDESSPKKEAECKCCAHYDEMSEFITADARLTSAQRKELPAEVFCGPERAFPVPDCAHYTAALRLLGRYQGEGDKEEIKACIEKRGKDMSCPTTKDAESLHMQLMKEQTESLVKMTQKLSAGALTMSKEDLDTLTGGISEMMWKMKDNIRIAKAMEMSIDEKDMLSTVKAIGDAAIMKHQIETKRETTGTTKPVKPGKYKLVPGYPDTHDHFVTLNDEGNGTSTKNDDHIHDIKAFNVELANEHSHTLQSIAEEEETSMSDEDKQKKDAADAAAKDKGNGNTDPTTEPTTKAPADQANPAEKPPEKDEATLYVDKLIKDEHTKLVDAIMDTEPSRERSHYEGKSLDELKELSEFISGQAASADSIPAGKQMNDEGKKVVNSAYADLEDKIRTK